ncbi:ureide permease 2-like isoform X3 [Tripterygium wilfordii]|uniref:ureide permease 2-like isoform X3 n=1 Tax=Tripterygium wilfordii TaxID=458696 RepID=UPI0018F84861|nr:ureide permease 2-like isoform X3 [Tripterygium wilfordii]
MQDNWPSVLFAMAGGVVLSLGNLSTQYAWAFVGLSVAEVITSSITVVIGTTLNYFLDDKINKAEILFPGVACFMIAVCLGSAVHSSNAADNRVKLSNLASDQNLAAGMTPASAFEGRKDLENGNATVEKAKFGTADFLVELENRRAIKVLGKSIVMGLAITFFAGVCLSLFSPAFNLATNDQWHTLKKGVPKLVLYTAYFYFSVSCFVIAIILNIILLYRPVLKLSRSSLKAYLNDWNGRSWALLAGLLCGFGNGLEFMGGQAAGYAAADSVQVKTQNYSSAEERDCIDYSDFNHRRSFGVVISGTSTCEHFLGNNSVWRVPEIIKTDLYIACQYANYVYYCRWRSHGLIWASKMSK